MKIIFSNSIREYECDIVRLDLSYITTGTLLITKDTAKLRQALRNIQNLPSFGLLEQNYHYVENCKKCYVTSITIDYLSDISSIKLEFYVPRYQYD